MTHAYSQSDVHNVQDVGQVLQATMLADDMGLSTSVPISGNVTSNLLFSNGYKIFTFGLTSSQNGSISIQRYIDAAGTIAQGAPLTASLTANTAAVYTLTDTAPYQTMTIEVLNSSGASIASLTNVILLFQAN